MCIDGYKVLTVRFQWEFLMVIHWIKLAGSFWPLRLDKDIVRQGNWILRNVESGVYSNSIVSTRPRGAISLWDMNHGGYPQAEFDLFHNIFGFKLVTFALNCFLESTKYWAGQYWFNIRFLLQFGCDSSSNTKARLEDIRVTLDCVCLLYLYIMWEACSWATDTAYWFPIQFDTREPISISSKEGWLRAFNYKEWHNAIVILWFWYLNWTRNLGKDRRT